jgi:hypothetical protein
MTEPVGTGPPLPRVVKTLRVRSGGPAAGVAAMSSLALVAAAIFGFGSPGLTAGRAQVTVEGPGQVRALVGPTQRLTSGPRPTGRDATDGPGPTGGSSGDRPAASKPSAPRPGASKGAQTTAPTGWSGAGSGGAGSGGGSSTTTGGTTSPTSSPRPVPHSQSAPPSPDVAQFQSPFSKTDVRVARVAVMQRVYVSLMNSPARFDAHKVVHQLRGRLDPPVLVAMDGAAKSAFDAAMIVKWAGGSDQQIGWAAECTFAAALPGSFHRSVLPVVLGTITDVAPNVAGLPGVEGAAQFAVPAATFEVAQATTGLVVADVVGQVNDTTQTNASTDPATDPSLDQPSLDQRSSESTGSPSDSPSDPATTTTQAPAATEPPGNAPDGSATTTPAPADPEKPPKGDPSPPGQGADGAPDVGAG